MRNEVFTALLCPGGGIGRLSRTDDPAGMNFCKAGEAFFAVPGFTMTDGREEGNTAEQTFRRDGLALTVRYALNETLSVEMTITNTNPWPYYFRQGEFSVAVPFADSYEDSVTCMRERCHAHVWAGLDSCCACGVRMGPSELHVGLVFTEGRFASYSQRGVRPNDRGVLLLDAAPFSLSPGESRRFSCLVFPFSSAAQFQSFCRRSPKFLAVESARGFTFEEGETIEFSFAASGPVSAASASTENGRAGCEVCGDTVRVRVRPERPGEALVRLTADDAQTYAAFFVTPPLEELIRRRLYFIVERQQCRKTGDPLDGAFLVYDNEEEAQYFDYKNADYNASRERLGMGILLAEYLLRHRDDCLEQALVRYTRFVEREFADVPTGRVFDTIGKDPAQKRLYNIPWATLYFTQLYRLWGREEYLDFVYRSLVYYYENGGTNFYPNGIRFYDFAVALKAGGKKKEYARIAALFDKHIGNIVKNGTAYPPHEVNFEQTIVTPAVTLLLDKYQLCGEEKYLREAEKHLRILRRFDGMQPHYRLNKIPIRYWDDFWFGKSHTYGDTFPHYWSALSGDCWLRYGRLTGNAAAEEYGRQCIRNTLCTINAAGRGTCAHVFPFRVLGARNRSNWWSAPLPEEFIPGGFDDAFANDQDFALYFALKAFGAETSDR